MTTAPFRAHWPRRRVLLLPLPLAWPGAWAQALSPAAPAGLPLRLLVAYPPGGVSDLVARALAGPLGAQLQQPVLVENRAGAAGTLALELLARAPADGRTLCLAAVTALADARAQRDPGGGSLAVAPVAALMRTPVLVVGTPALASSNFAGLLERARRLPGVLRWATTGEGTTGHRVLERVQQASGASFVHVPYKGGGQQVADALAGHFEVLSTNVAAPQLAAVRSGRLAALAVGAPARLPVLPQVPTLAETGFPSANLSSLFGLFAPSGTPPAAIARINAAVGQALDQPRLRALLLEMNNVPVGGSAASFAEMIRAESQR